MELTKQVSDLRVRIAEQGCITGFTLDDFEDKHWRLAYVLLLYPSLFAIKILQAFARFYEMISGADNFISTLLP
jgi:hypothetical protein